MSDLVTFENINPTDLILLDNAQIRFSDYYITEENLDFYQTIQDNYNQSLYVLQLAEQLSQQFTPIFENIVQPLSQELSQLFTNLSQETFDILSTIEKTIQDFDFDNKTFKYGITQLKCHENDFDGSEIIIEYPSYSSYINNCWTTYQQKLLLQKYLTTKKVQEQEQLYKSSNGTKPTDYPYLPTLDEFKNNPPYQLLTLYEYQTQMYNEVVRLNASGASCKNPTLAVNNVKVESQTYNVISYPTDTEKGYYKQICNWMGLLDTSKRYFKIKWNNNTYNTNQTPKVNIEIKLKDSMLGYPQGSVFSNAFWTKGANYQWHADKHPHWTSFGEARTNKPNIFWNSNEKSLCFNDPADDCIVMIQKFGQPNNSDGNIGLFKGATFYPIELGNLMFRFRVYENQ